MEIETCTCAVTEELRDCEWGVCVCVFVSEPDKKTVLCVMTHFGAGDASLHI